MKKTKILAALTAAAMLSTVLLTACESKGNSNETDDTAADTTSPTESVTTAGTGGTIAPEVTGNYMNMVETDLSAYITLPDYKNMELVCNFFITEEELDDELKNIAETYNYTVPEESDPDRLTAAGDLLNIDFFGTMDGVPFEGGAAEGAIISLTEQTGYIDGFDADLYGIKAGTTVTTKVTFPENYGSEMFNGKDAEFVITVNGFAKYGMNDATVTTYTNGEYTTVAAFRDYIRKSVISDRLENKDSYIINVIFKALMDAAEIKSLPEDHVNFYYSYIYSYYVSYFEMNFGSASYDFNDFLAYYGITADGLKTEAEEMTKQDMLLGAIFAAEGLTISDDEYNERVAEMAKENGYTDTAAMNEQMGAAYVRGVVLNDFCIEWLVANLEYATDYDAVNAEYGEATAE